jgi:DNA-binding CsgD family transcriptional regulator
MKVPLTLTAAYFLHLLITAAVIIGAYRLQRHYALSFLSTFFYSIVFYSIYDFINFFGGVFGVMFLSPSGSEFFWSPVLSCPPLAVSLYFMFVWVAQALEKTLSSWFRAIYWIIQAGLFAFVFYHVLGQKMVDGMNKAGFNFYRFMLVELILIQLFFIVVFILALGMNRGSRRRMIVGLCLSYIGSWSLLAILSDKLKIPHHMNQKMGIIFMSLLLASINIPALLFLRAFLKKNYSGLQPSTDESETLERWFAGHHLSPRERDVIGLILKGETNREIAKDLFLSEKTVKNNISSVFLKTGIKSRARLIVILRETLLGSEKR